MKIYKLLTFTAVLVIALFIVIFGYQQIGTNQKLVKVPVKKRVLLISYVYQNPYWQIVKKGAEDAAKNRNCILEYEGPQTPNIEESLKLLDMGIAASVDGIVTYVQENQKYIPYIKKASDNGIPVVTVDTDERQSDRIAFVGTNNIEAGSAAGQELMALTSSKANIGIIMAGETTASQIDRVYGFKEYISNYPGMKVIGTEYSNSDIIESELVAKKLIKENPSLNALYCTSSVDGIGAARAVVDYNKVGKITIVCFDDLPETLSFIRQRIIQVSIVQKPYQMGYDSVNLIMDRLEGKLATGDFLLGNIVVTADNVNNYNIGKGDMY